MFQSSRFVAAILAVAAILVCGPLAAADDPPKPAEGGAKVVMGGRGGGMFYGLPGYYLLENEAVQKEIELVAEQKEKLKEIAKQYYEDVQQDAKVDWSNLRDLSAEEQRKRIDEVRQKYEKRIADVKSKVEKVLLSHQLEQLKQVQSRSRAASMLYSPNVLEQLSITDEQKDKFRQIREEVQSKVQQLQQESLDKTLAVLTAEQRKKLDDLSKQGFGGMMWGPPKEIKREPDK